MPDSPKNVALGVALGTSLNFLPMPFVSIPISYILARLFRINATAAVLSVIFMKWAVPFFFTFNYYLGRQLLGLRPSGHVKHHFQFADISSIVLWIKGLGTPFMLGAAINSIVFGVCTYFAINALISYRLRNKTPKA
ncbi:MAG: DUF2062 domain-containing protein [Peptococcaceae bacterium]|nr:DUF2062 domain-containing protein [Peptococcaceae bacterium]